MSPLDRDVSRLDRLLLDSTGRLRPVESRALDGIDVTSLVVWCARRAVDVVPTHELIGWLRYRIAGRRAIEVAAGNGAVGRAIPIPMTDAVSRDEDVERSDALEAVRRHNPQVVIGAWITELDGVPEDAILDHPSVETFILVGNTTVRRHRRLMRRRTELVRASWLRSGSMRPDLNCVVLWDTGRRL